MKRVWKCDFCSQTNINSDKIKEHEKECSFNPKFRNCFSCIHRPYSYSDCKKNLNYWQFETYDEEYGYCTEWKSDNEKLLRKIKLQEINKIKE
jgi:hypothetical protein